MMFSWYPKDRGCQRIECPHYKALVVDNLNLKDLSYIDSPDVVQCELERCLYDSEPVEFFPRNNPQFLNILTREEVERFI